jgi:putative ABC transport system permease protein
MSSTEAAGGSRRSGNARRVSNGWPLVLRLALRELRTGLGGFYIFIACMALGVAVITGVGALGDALRAGFESQGETILGGDATLARVHQRVRPEERAWMDARGRVSETATMRSMGRTLDGSDQALIELKAADRAYPLVGSALLKGGGDLQTLLAAPGAAVVDPLLLERLKLGVGERFRIGQLEARIAGVIEKEPDTISDRVIYGPRVLVSMATLDASGLVQPGTLIRWRYAMKLPASDPASLGALRTGVRQDLPEAGFMIADRRDPSPQVTRTLDRLRQFLTLIGLTSLLIGGIGVANAVATFIDRRRKAIATMRSLGASGQMVLGIFFTQVMMIAGIGIAIGVVAGYLIPLALDRLYGASLPITVVATVSPASILYGVAYGVLVAALFTLWPLGRAEQIRPGVLFREDVAPTSAWPSKKIVAMTVVCLVGLVAFAILGSDSRWIAAYFLGATAAVLGLFAVFGWGVTKGAARVPKPRSAEVKLALGNIAAPDGLTRSVILSLGAGLSLMVAVALVDASIRAELTTRAPQHSPTYFVLDIPRSDRDTFVDLVRRASPQARIDEAPMLRGRIVSLKGEPTDGMQVAPEAQWVLQGDRGLTYSTTVPDGSKVVKGEWWQPDYAGEPLVSFEVDLARRLKVDVGDTVTVNVLGRNLTARISSLREVKWESLAINFVMVFSPNALRAAPHNLLATVTLPEPIALATEAAVQRSVAVALPSVTMVRVKDALEAFQAVFAKVMTAVQVAGGVTLLAGALVLAGALATAQRRRIKQAVILKTLGATQRRIIASHLVEYATLAALTAALAILLGTAAAWVTLTQVMELELAFSAVAVLQALGFALAMVLAFGAIGTWSVLRVRPAAVLRSDG